MRLPAFVVLVALLACSSPAPKVALPVGDDADPTTLPRYTPRWAFEPWVSKDISNGPDTYDFVDGFIARDIPVGVVVLDSPWETNYNTFVPNPSRYPDFPKLLSDMHARDVRVVLWVTQMVNQTSFDLEAGGDTYVGPSPNWAEGRRNGYFVNDGALYTWWKGQGAGVDFFNPAAVKWWRAQQDALLALGINGWKLDFGEDYITDQPLETFAGTKTLQEYSEAYYRDFLVHGLKRRGREEFLTMVRPYDKSYVFSGRFYARPEHAPVGWVGDNRRDWVGLKDALDHIFRSARAGYVVVGSDIGGYLDFDDVDMSIRVPFSQANFARWVAVGAMTPFMQLHGRGNLTPWTVPERVDETVELYRYWAKLHHQLVPFFFSTAQAAYAGGPVPIQPIGDEPEWTDDYRFVVGDAFLVAPILDDTGVRDVPLPAGARWVDWWTGAAHDGGTTLAAVDMTDRRRIPLYVKEGAVVPASVDDDSTGLGTAASKGALTVLAWPGPQPRTFTVHHEDGATVELTASRDAQALTVGLSRAPGGAVLRVWTDGRAVQTVTAGTPLPQANSRAALDTLASGWFADGAYTWVRLPAGAAPVTVELRQRPATAVLSLRILEGEPPAASASGAASLQPLDITWRGLAEAPARGATGWPAGSPPRAAPSRPPAWPASRASSPRQSTRGCPAAPTAETRPSARAPPPARRAPRRGPAAPPAPTPGRAPPRRRWPAPARWPPAPPARGGLHARAAPPCPCSPATSAPSACAACTAASCAARPASAAGCPPTRSTAARRRRPARAGAGGPSPSSR